MTVKFETVKKRYLQGFVRDDQLRKYWELGAITDDEYVEIYQCKYPNQYPEGLEPEPVIVEPEETTEPEQTETVDTNASSVPAYPTEDITNTSSVSAYETETVEESEE